MRLCYCSLYIILCLKSLFNNVERQTGVICWEPEGYKCNRLYTVLFLLRLSGVVIMSFWLSINDISLYNLYIVSWEPEGRYCRSKMFRWEPEGRYCHWLCTAIAPFWFSMEHLWAAITPIWLSSDDILSISREVVAFHTNHGSFLS